MSLIKEKLYQRKQFCTTKTQLPITLTTDQDLPKDLIAQRSGVYVKRLGTQILEFDFDRQKRQVDHLEVDARFHPSVDAPQSWPVQDDVD